MSRSDSSRGKMLPESCSCEAYRLVAPDGTVLEGVKRHDPNCRAHGFPNDEWRAGSPLERHAKRLRFTTPKTYTHGDYSWTRDQNVDRTETPREVTQRLMAELHGGMCGRIYLERKRPVCVLTRWLGNGPRNVLIYRYATGERVVRSFRGLRRAPGGMVVEA